MKKKKFLGLLAVVAFLGCSLGFFQPTNTSSNVAYATEMGQPIMYKKNVTITTNGYKIWGDFKGSNWTQRSHSKDHLNKTYNANAYYVHPTTKEKYYSLFTEPNAKGTWIGYLNEKAIQVAKEATITIKYVDSSGKALKTATTAKAFYKDIYTASAATIAGYTLMDSDSQSFVVSGDRTVTFTYKKNAPVKYNVTVQHVSGNTVLKTDKAVQVEKGKNYTAKSTTISGYTLKGASTQTKTINGNTTIKFEYTKNAPVKYNVTVQHVNGNTVLKTDKAVQVEKGKSYTAKATTISGYTLKGASTQTKTINGNTTIKFEYTKNAPVKYNVTVQHVSGKTVLKTDKAVQVEKGKSYTAKAAAISGYTIKGAKTQTKTINGNTTVTFEYTKNAPVKYNVTVKHVSGKTVLKTDKAVQVEKGKSYTAKAAAISGYTIKGAKTQTKTINGNTTIKFEYTKNAVDKGISYRTHVQSYGWQTPVANGATSGTTGKAKRLEGINIYNNTGLTGDIIYQTHVQSIGWQTAVKSPTMSGTEKRSLRLEAIKISLTGKLAEKYDVYYRVHAQHFGWLDWAKNGLESGSAGYGYRLEGIQIVLVAKGGKAPGSTKRPFEEKANDVKYRTHVQSYGWQQDVANGAVSGTVGQAKRLEAIQLRVSGPKKGSIQYRTHIQSIGWEQQFKKDGQDSGTSGRALRLEAIQIKLSGDIAKKYDVYYRVHAQTFGWLGWAKNGASAGTAGYAYRLEGIQVKLVAKGQKAPGSTANAFKEKQKLQQFTVTVIHKGSDNKELAKETVKVDKGASYTAKAKSFNGYTLKGSNTQTIKVAANKTLTFNYQKNAAAVNKAELKKLYDSVAKLTKGNYTDASWQTFDTARSNAKKVLDDAKATQAQVDNAKNGLRTAKNDLQQKPAPVVKFKVTVVHKSGNTNLETEKAVEVEKGKTFTGKAKSFGGYTLSGATSQTVTVNGDTTIIFNYISTATKTDIVKMNAWCDGKLFKTVTKELVAGEKFTPSTYELNLDPKEYDLSVVVVCDTITGVGGKTYSYDFRVTKLTTLLNTTELAIAKKTIFRLVNELRVSRGLNPVEENEILDKATAVRAKEIQELYAHQRPNGGTVASAVTQFGYHPGSYGENITRSYRGFTDGVRAGTALFESWKVSAPHLSLMLAGDVVQLGIGLHADGREVYAVQIFSDGIFEWNE